MRSYLRFNVQGLNRSVSRATLRIYANSASTLGLHLRSAGDNAWTESTINYNNAPLVGSVIGSFSPVGAVCGSVLTSLLTSPGTALTIWRSPRRGVRRSALPDVIFADGFESGDLSAWSSNESDLGDLIVTAVAALDGDNGLQAEINDNNPTYIMDDTPNAEARYRVRFYFNPNSIQMAEGESFYLFTGYSDSAIDVLRVEFRIFNGIYQLRAALRDDGNIWTNSDWIDLEDITHMIELSWSAASTGEEDGRLILWVDELQVANLTQIDNDTRQIDEVRLGGVDEVDTGTRGTLYFDAFDSCRQTYIGPVEPPTGAPR